MFFFSKDNVASKGESEILKEIERKKKQDQDQTKRIYDKIKQKMKTKEDFQKGFQEVVNKYLPEQRKYFNTLSEIKEFIQAQEKIDPQNLRNIKSLAFYSKYIQMNKSDYKKLIQYLSKLPELKILWLTVSVATFGEDRLNCDENSLEELRKSIKELYGQQLEALYVKFNYDAHDCQWNNRKITVHTINDKWDETFEKDLPQLYRCDYQFCGMLV